MRTCNSLSFLFLGFLSFLLPSHAFGAGGEIPIIVPTDIPIDNPTGTMENVFLPSAICLEFGITNTLTLAVNDPTNSISIAADAGHKVEFQLIGYTFDQALFSCTDATCKEQWNSGPLDVTYVSSVGDIKNFTIDVDLPADFVGADLIEGPYYFYIKSVAPGFVVSMPKYKAAKLRVAGNCGAEVVCPTCPECEECPEEVACPDPCPPYPWWPVVILVFVAFCGRIYFKKYFV